MLRYTRSVDVILRLYRQFVSRCGEAFWEGAFEKYMLPSAMIGTTVGVILTPPGDHLTILSGLTGGMVGALAPAVLPLVPAAAVTIGPAYGLGLLLKK